MRREVRSLTCWRACRGCRCFFQAEDGIRDLTVTGVQTCALPIYVRVRPGLYRLRRLPLGGLRTQDLQGDGPRDEDGRAGHRSEERRVGKEGRSRWSPYL